MSGGELMPGDPEEGETSNSEISGRVEDLSSVPTEVLIERLKSAHKNYSRLEILHKEAENQKVLVDAEERVIIDPKRSVDIRKSKKAAIDEIVRVSEVLSGRGIDAHDVLVSN